MNKRADITVTVLVIGIIVVCFFALLTFYLSSLKISGSFKGIGMMQKVNARMELGGGDIETDGLGSYILEEEKGRRSWYSLKKNKLLFEVKYYLPT